MSDDLFFLLDDPLEPDAHENSQTRGLADNVFDRLNNVPAVKPPERPQGEQKARRSVSELLKANDMTVSPDNVALTRGSVTVAVFGAWGSGKTSFLKLLERRYRHSGSTTVWFEPWRYEREEHLLIPLLVEFSSTISHRLKKDAVKQAALETAKTLVGRAGKAILRTGGKLVDRQLGFDPYQIGETFIEQYGEKSADWTESLSEINKFRQSLYDMIELAAAADIGVTGDSEAVALQYPVAVFIDDLDRCNPGQVRRLLESVKIFLDAPGCVFFIALDEEQVQFALAEPYRDLYPQSDGVNIRANTQARRYLDKFFQYSIHLSDGYSLYDESVGDLRNKLWDVLSRNLDKRLTGQLKDLERTFYCIRANPRTLKRAARWLYFEQVTTSPEKLPAEFAELAFAVNYETVWVGELQGQTLETRSRFYTACSDVMSDGSGNLDASRLNAALIEIAQLSQGQGPSEDEGPPPQEPPEDEGLPREEPGPSLSSEAMLAQAYPQFVETLHGLVTRRQENEQKNLAFLVWQASKLVAAEQDGAEASAPDS